MKKCEKNQLRGGKKNSCENKCFVKQPNEKQILWNKITWKQMNQAEMTWKNKSFFDHKNKLMEKKNSHMKNVSCV